eukprot:4025290-Prymnesium_polylepis.1
MSHRVRTTARYGRPRCASHRVRSASASSILRHMEAIRDADAGRLAFSASKCGISLMMRASSVASNVSETSRRTHRARRSHSSADTSSALSADA